MGGLPLGRILTDLYPGGLGFDPNPGFLPPSWLVARGRVLPAVWIGGYRCDSNRHLWPAEWALRWGLWIARLLPLIGFFFEQESPILLGGPLLVVWLSPLALIPGVPRGGGGPPRRFRGGRLGPSKDPEK
ncbi:MAG: hypothetical protein CM15mP77_2120 [Synechococcus sp.]|nr:MAG: hypothetical protein CM15mP77_2120 [Synechococcus sp.]